MMNKKNMKRLTVMLVICTMLMNGIAMFPVSAEEVILPEAAVEEAVPAETAETVETAAEEPEAEEPAAEEPAAEEPAAEEPATDKPAVEEPVVEEPEVEEPVVEKPAVEEPVVEEPEEDEKIYIQMFVNGVATVYENPEVDEEHELCKMQNGEVIEVIKYDEDWYEVKTGGYIMKENLRLEAEKQIEEEPVAEESVTKEPVVEEAADEEPAADGEPVTEEPTVDEEPVVEESAADEEPTAEEETIEDYETPLGIYEYKTIVLGDEETGISVRENADSLAAIYTTLPAGTEVTVLRQDGDWVMVFANDAYGFVYIDDLAGYLDLEEKEEEPNEGIVALEKKVTIFTSRRSIMEEGEEISLTSKLEGFEDCAEIRYVWKVDKGNGFEVVEGATGDTLTYTASIESLNWDWHLTVMYR